MKRAAKCTSAVFAGVVTVLLASGLASADLVTMHTANATTGNQSWGGVGWTFDVTTPITVADLGIFDSGADGIGGTGTLTTVLFDAGQDVIASMSFTAGAPGTLAGAYRFKSLEAPLSLSAGQYTIVGYGWDGTNPEHNTNNTSEPDPVFNGGGAAEFVKSVWTASGTDGAPTWPTDWYDTGRDYFDGPNMRFAVVPLPGAVLLGALGLGVAGVRLRRSVA